LISCSKKKLQGPEAIEACKLYQGTLFKYSYKYAQETLFANEIFILSAMHELLPAHQRIHYYDLKLADLPVAERRAWGESVAEKLVYEVAYLNPIVFVLAGKTYMRYIEEHIDDLEVVYPLRGLGGIGKQIAWLKRMAV